MKSLLRSALEYSGYKQYYEPLLPFLIISPQFLNIIPEIFLFIIKYRYGCDSKDEAQCLKNFIDFIENNAPTFHLQLICPFVYPLESVETLEARCNKMDYIFNIVIMVHDFNYMDYQQGMLLHPLVQVDASPPSYYHEENSSEDDSSSSTFPLLYPISRFGQLLLSRPELRQIGCFGDILNCPNFALTLLVHHKSAPLRRRALQLLDYNETYWKDNRRVDLLLERIEVMFRHEINDDVSAVELVRYFGHCLLRWLWDRIDKDFSRIRFLMDFVVHAMVNVKTPGSLEAASHALFLLIREENLDLREKLFEELSMNVADFISIWLDRARDYCKEIFVRLDAFSRSAPSRMDVNDLVQKIRNIFLPIQRMMFWTGHEIQDDGEETREINYYCWRFRPHEEVFGNFLHQCFSLHEYNPSCGTHTESLSSCLFAFIKSKFIRRRENFFSQLMSNLKKSEFEKLVRPSEFCEDSEESKLWVQSTSFLNGVTVRDFVAMMAGVQTTLVDSVDVLDTYFSAIRNLKNTADRDVDLLLGRLSDGDYNDVDVNPAQKIFTPQELHFLLRRQALPFAVYDNVYYEDDDNDENVWQQDDLHRYLYPKNFGVVGKQAILSKADDDDEQKTSSPIQPAVDSGEIKIFRKSDWAKFHLDDWIFNAFQSILNRQKAHEDNKYYSSFLIEMFIARIMFQIYNPIYALQCRNMYVKHCRLCSSSHNAEDVAAFSSSPSNNLFFYADRGEESERKLFDLTFNATVDECKMYFEAFFVENNNTHTSPKIRFWETFLSEDVGVLRRRKEPTSCTAKFILVSIYRLHRLYFGCRGSASKIINNTDEKPLVFDIVSYLARILSSSPILEARILEMYASRYEFLTLFSDTNVGRMSSFDESRELDLDYRKNASRDLTMLLLEAEKLRSGDDEAVAVQRLVVAIVQSEEKARFQIQLEEQHEFFNKIVCMKMIHIQPYMNLANGTVRRQREE